MGSRFYRRVDNLEDDRDSPLPLPTLNELLALDDMGRPRPPRKQRKPRKRRVENADHDPYDNASTEDILPLPRMSY